MVRQIIYPTGYGASLQWTSSNSLGSRERRPGDSDYAGNRPWSMTKIFRDIVDRYAKMRDPNSVRHILDRGPPLKTYKGVPMEEKRFEVTGEDI
jgi:hypothetical protein